MKPNCILWTRVDKLASVCAWCPDKETGDVWCAVNGYSITHSMCPTCKDKLMATIPQEPVMVTAPWLDRHGIHTEKDMENFLNGGQ